MGAPTGGQRLPPPAAPGPAQGPPRNARRVRPPSGLPKETHFHLSVSTCSFFVFYFTDNKRRSWESQAPAVWDATGIACWQIWNKAKGQGPLDHRLPSPSPQRDRVHQRAWGGPTGLLLQPLTHLFHTHLHAEEQDPLVPSREPPDL